MHAAVMLEQVLEGVAAALLFVNDAGGAVRGEMFHRALDTLADLAAGQPYAAGMIAAERANHAMLGVSPVHFDAYFHAMGDVFREALGAQWTQEVDTAWRGLMTQVSAIHAHTAG